MALDLPEGVSIDGVINPDFEKVLTKEAIAFVADLQRRFNPRREELLAARAERQKRLDAGEKPDFLPRPRRSARATGPWRRCRRTSSTAASRSPARSTAR